MRIGTSLRGHFPSNERSLPTMLEVAKRMPPGSFIDLPIGEPGTRRQATNLVEVARAARDARLDFLLIGDHHAMPVSNFFQPTPALARMLAETGQMPVGILYLAPFLHPVLMAEQVGTLAAFAPEPFTLVLSIGAGEAQFRAFGMRERERTGRTEETVAIVRALLAGESVAHRGRYFALDGVRIAPIPAVPTPIWIGGRIGAAVERAARLGDGWLTGTTSTDAELAAELACYRDACAKAGRAPNPILRRDVHVAATDAQARADVGAIMAAGYRNVGYDDVIVGCAETVVERLRSYERMGFATALVRHITGDHRLMLDSFARLGADVLPNLR